MRTLTTGYLHPESIFTPVGFQDQPWVATECLGKIPSTVQQDMGGEGIKITGIMAQKAVANPYPLLELQVSPGFKLRLAIDVDEEMVGDTTPLTDSGRSFCLSYHLESVCNSSFGGRRMHRSLFSREHGPLRAGKAKLCGAAPPPLLEVDATSLGGITIITKSCISW